MINKMDDFVFEDHGSDEDQGFAPPIEYNNKHISFNPSIDSIDSQLFSIASNYDKNDQINSDDQSLESSGVLWLIDTFNLESRVLSDTNYVDYTMSPSKLSLAPNTKNISQFASYEASETDIDFDDQFDPKSFILLDDNIKIISNNKSPPKFDRNGSLGLMLNPESNNSIPLEFITKHTPYLNSKYINKTNSQIREDIKKQDRLDRIKATIKRSDSSNENFKSKLDPLKMTFIKTKSVWSKDTPPTSGLFDDVNRLTLLQNQRERFVKNLKKSSSQKKVNKNNFPSISTAIIDPISGEFLGASNESQLDNVLIKSSSDEFRGLSDILVLDHGKVGSSPKEAANQLTSFGIATYRDSLSQTFEDQSDLFGSNRGFDPLYRIMREESERLDEEIRLKTILSNTIGPKCGNDGSRKIEIDLMAMSSSVMRANEIIKLKQFDSLPPKLWVTARIVYILLVFYHDLIVSGEAFEGPDVPQPVNISKPKSPTQPQQAKKKTEIKVKIIKPLPLQMISLVNDKQNSSIDETHPGDDEYLTNLENKVGMKLFWSKLNITRTQNQISCETAYSFFNWNYLKELMSMPNEFAYALYMIEAGGLQSIILNNSIDELPENVDDFYSKFPEELLPVLREAGRSSTFHPSIVVSLSIQAGRLTSWARRVIAGIYSIKLAYLRLSITSKQTKKEDNNEKKSLFSTLNLNPKTPQKRVEQAISYKKSPSLESTSSIQSLNIQVVVDGSALSHISSLVAMSLSRPLDRVSIIAVQNPTGIKNTSVIMNELVKSYESLINTISNSPTQRVMFYDTLVNEFKNRPKSTTKRIPVSFKDIQSNNHIKDVHVDINTNIDTVGVEKMVTLSLQTYADMFVVGYGWGRNFEYDKSLYKNLLNFRKNPFGLVLVSQFTKNNLFPDFIYPSTPSNTVIDKPIVTNKQLAFTSSRFVIFIDNTKYSRVIFDVRKYLYIYTYFLFISIITN